MDIDDPVHGSASIDEPVLQELIRSDPVQRLKHVNQAGPQQYYMDKPVTRYDHSVGVMLLLRRFDAALEEQIAGLLHDVPHTAFSHLADFVFDTDDHEYHERFMEDVVRNSDIPAILERHGIALDDILDEQNFPLLERDLPDLCADRIDYFLRDWHVVGGEDITAFRHHLAVDGDMFVLDDRDVAEAYALAYLDAEERRELAVWELFARAVRRALDTGILGEDDLFGTDDEVYRQLQAADDDRIQDVLARLERGIDVTVEPDDPDVVVETKPRWVDPVVATERQRVRVTDYSAAVERRIAEHRETLDGGIPLTID
ncbi:MAG: HD domain-containing protein [Candidatus Nanohaloarchaea archaeon]|nr:HD domain-containing protein [Candidatus Nanohaloarchaea archaeon]